MIRIIDKEMFGNVRVGHMFVMRVKLPQLTEMLSFIMYGIMFIQLISNEYKNGGNVSFNI